MKIAYFVSMIASATLIIIGTLLLNSPQWLIGAICVAVNLVFLYLNWRKWSAMK